mgnify:CR=1 FL=1
MSYKPVDQSEIFDELYPPDTTLPQSDAHNSGDEEGNGMYECRNEADWAIVRAANPLCVWTVVEGDEGLYMTSGIHYVNRECYYVSSVPRPSEEHLEYCIRGYDAEDNDYE